MKKQRKKNLGDFQPWRGKQRSQSSRRLNVSVTVRRDHNKYTATACFGRKRTPTPSERAFTVGRCGFGSGPSPGRAISWALAGLSRAARKMRGNYMPAAVMRKG